MRTDTYIAIVLLGLGLITIPCTPLRGQQAPPAPLKVGVGLAGFSYRGDLTYGEQAYRRVYPGIQVSLQFEGKRRIQPQFNASYGSFWEQLDTRTWVSMPDATPNQFVETRFFSADIRLVGYILRQGPVRPYVSAGVGLMFFSPYDEDGNFLGENIFTRLPEEGYGPSSAVFPVGGGVALKVNQVLWLNLGYHYRFTPTDYLDNIGLLGNGPGTDGLHALVLSLQGVLQAGPPAPSQPRLPLPPPQIALPDLAWLDPAVTRPADRAVSPQFDRVQPDTLSRLAQAYSTMSQPALDTLVARALSTGPVVTIMLYTPELTTDLGMELGLPPEVLHALNPALGKIIPAFEPVRLPDPGLGIR